MKTVKLVVAYNNRTLSIPFKSIALIDDFTTYYDSLYDLGIALNEILDLKLYDQRITKIYICKTTTKEESNIEYNEYLPIRYSFDKYDPKSVEEAFIDYIHHHQELLFDKHSPLWRITNNYIKKYNKINLSEFDINRIATLYLKSDKGTYNYNRMRETYFTLLKNEYKIHTMKQQEANPHNRTDLTKYDTEDDFYEYLKHYSTLGEEEKAKAIEILSGERVEDIERKISHPEYNLFDTQEIKYQRDYHDDALLLQALTDMTNQELINLVNDYQQEVKGKTKGK